jgi:hypothetical protein
MRRHKVLTAASVAAALSAVGVSLHFHDLIRQARLAQLGSELESARQGREIEQLRRGGDPPRVLPPFEEGLERAHDWIRRGDLAQATAQLEELRAAAVAEARSEAARTVRRELARVALARADYALAELEFRSLARTAGHSVPGQLAQFEESVAVYLQGDVGRAAVIWRHLLESHGLTPGHRMLCRGMLGELTPAEFAARSARELPLPRALGLWLAAERTKDTQQGQTWRRAAAAAATDVLPWLYYFLNKRPASASEPQRASEAQP